ncbi:hypothetical protein [Aeromonas sp. Y311-2]|uniref:hypothetical protein n=1 Tax=Aeromonas TaxID=642 RepID=UPI0022E2A187|nr:hypothetical protein [Aeromonas sp. Y311-2]
MSSQRKVSIQAEIYKTLVVDRLDGFTLKELRDAYVDYLALRSTPAELGAYRKVYRQVLRLQKRGLLAQFKIAGEPAKYYKTPLFYDTIFVEVFHRDVMPPAVIKKNMASIAATQQHFVEQLQCQAGQYQAELLTIIGESEEYQRLSEEFPGMRSKFETDYLQSTERRSKLLGQLRAIETVIIKYANM